MKIINDSKFQKLELSKKAEESPMIQATNPKLESMQKAQKKYLE